ncbi:hypothetical protein SAMN05216416_0975 [Streptococcus equinus]|nr:hypothetical protein SAMN05216416_0975 [Streptococcus equinus]
MIFSRRILITEEKFGIDTLEYEINHQELDGESAAGARTAIRMTVQGRCGYILQRLMNVHRLMYVVDRMYV